MSEWQPISSAPRNATNVQLRVPTNRGRGFHVVIGHYAQDLSGSEQPPFKGWFRETGWGFVGIEPEPTHWAPYEAPSLPPHKCGGPDA